MDFSLASLWPFACAAALFITLKLGYYCLGILPFRHPITAGLVIWLVTGDFNLLLAALFFELLWLDLFYVGTFVPPDNLLAYLLFAPLSFTLGLGAPQDACILMLACMPFAAMGGKLEARLRFTESAGYKKVNQAIDSHGDIMATVTGIIRGALGKLVVTSFMVYSLAAMLLYGGAALWLWKTGAMYRIEWAGWGFILCLAALGGLLSLRIPWARVCFGACVLVAGGLYVF